MKTTLHSLTFLLPLMALLTGCSLFGTDPLEIPDSYPADGYEANTTAERAMIDQFSDLVNEMKLGRNEANSLSVDQLTDLYTSGTSPLYDATHPYYRDLVLDWLVELAAASGTRQDLMLAPQGEGGVYGAYLFDETGLELEQLVDKGLFGALFYHQAIQVINGPIDETTADKLVALFGANPAFTNSDNGSLHNNPDILLAKYAARRDPADGTGLYTQIRDAFIQLKAATTAADEYPEERDNALLLIPELWEKANAATIINYLYAAIDKLGATSPSEADVASAMHAYGEAVGFLHGWRQLSIGRRMITDDQIDDLLVKMLAPAGGTAEAYLFAQQPFTYLPQLEEAITDLQGIYGFTNAELEGFKKNWVSEQNR